MGEESDKTPRRGDAGLLRPRRDRRDYYRINVAHVLGRVEATVQPDAVAGVTLTGRVIDIAATGCCLVVPAWIREVLSTGDRCTVSLPVQPTESRRYPALVKGIAPYGAAPSEVMLRLRLQPCGGDAYPQLINWLKTMALYRWYL